jgi:hypothetical protein
VGKPAALKPEAAPEEKPAGEGATAWRARPSANHLLFYWSLLALLTEEIAS